MGTDRPEVWAEIAPFYDATRALPGDGEERTFAAIARTVRDAGARSVLDLGCGTGRWAIPLARAGLAVTGVDRSRDMLERLRAKPDAALARVVRADAAALPFRDAFDAVVLSHVLHLVPALEPIASGVRPALRPGALLLVVDMNGLPRPASERVLAALMPHLGETFVPWAHGDASRDRALLQGFGRLVGAGPVSMLPVADMPQTRSLRQHLDAARARVWSMFRTRDAETMRRAADAAERDLVRAGADLDAPIAEAIGVRLLLSRLGA